MVLEGAPFLRFEDSGDAPAPAFGGFQFFQKLPLSFILITPGNKTAGLQVLQSNGTVGAWIADDGDGIGQDPDPYGFLDLIVRDNSGSAQPRLGPVV